jgi:hypothetical protein
VYSSICPEREGEILDVDLWQSRPTWAVNDYIVIFVRS